MTCCRRWTMKHKKNSFLDLLEAYFNTYLPVAKGLSTATVTSYKATFRILIEFMYTVKGIPAEKIYFEILDAQMITEFLDWLESERKCSIATRNQRVKELCDQDRKSTRLNSSHVSISYAVFCLKKKKKDY